MLHRAVVTGATGFIGGHLVENLAAKIGMSPVLSGEKAARIFSWDKKLKNLDKQKVL